MMPAKVAALGLPKIKVFWSKGYDILISVMSSPTKLYCANQIIL